jgi:hypothetical protein
MLALPLKEFCLGRGYTPLLYPPTGGCTYAPCCGGRTPGGVAYIKLRLLRRLPSAGEVEVALTVPEELADCIDSFELLLVCCTLVGAGEAVLVPRLAARRVKGLLVGAG